MKTVGRYLALVGFVGILLGVVTSFGQTFLPAPFTQLANSYSIWLLFSFLIGYFCRSLPISVVAAAGAVVQYIAIMFYYLASSLRFDTMYSFTDILSLNLVWIAGGTLAGPIASIAGSWAVKKSRDASIAVSFMAGLFLSEGFYQLLNLHYVGEGLVFIGTALIFLAATYLKFRYSVFKALIFTLGFSGVMYVGYAYVLGGLFG